MREMSKMRVERSGQKYEKKVCAPKGARLTIFESIIGRISCQWMPLTLPVGGLLGALASWQGLRFMSDKPCWGHFAAITRPARPIAGTC